MERLVLFFEREYIREYWYWVPLLKKTLFYVYGEKDKKCKLRGGFWNNAIEKFTTNSTYPLHHPTRNSSNINHRLIPRATKVHKLQSTLDFPSLFPFYARFTSVSINHPRSPNYFYRDRGRLNQPRVVLLFPRL